MNNYHSMKAIIDGKRYDTETSTEIARAESDASYTDFAHWTETLYRTPKGNYFLAGFGNGLSKYAEHYRDHYTSGEEIIPFTEGEAFAWAQVNSLEDIIEQYFPSFFVDA